MWQEPFCCSPAPYWPWACSVAKATTAPAAAATASVAAAAVARLVASSLRKKAISASRSATAALVAASSAATTCSPDDRAATSARSVAITSAGDGPSSPAAPAVALWSPRALRSGAGSVATAEAAAAGVPLAAEGAAAGAAAAGLGGDAKRARIAAASGSLSSICRGTAEGWDGGGGRRRGRSMLRVPVSWHAVRRCRRRSGRMEPCVTTLGRGKGDSGRRRGP
jgi:hypothetical protein